MKDQRIGYAIVGTGSIANTHALAISKTSNSYLVGALGTKPEKTREFSKNHGCRAFSSMEELCSCDEVDAVVVATPSGAHLDVSLRALEANKHVIIEKPLEISQSRCDEIIKLGRTKGLKVGGVFQSRFYEGPRLIKKAIEEGRLGKITMADAVVKWYRSQAYYDSGAWRGTWSLDGGGALMNQAIHAVDLLCWFAGDVQQVQAFCSTLAHERIEVEDTAVAALRFENGALGVIEASTSVFPGFLKRIEISGTKGSIVLEEEAIKTWKFDEERPQDQEIRERFCNNAFSGGSADPKAINTLGHQRQFEDFAQAIIDDRPCFITGAEASKAVTLITSIYESAKAQKPVYISK